MIRGHENEFTEKILADSNYNVALCSDVLFYKYKKNDLCRIYSAGFICSKYSCGVFWYLLKWIVTEKCPVSRAFLIEKLKSAAILKILKKSFLNKH